MEAFGAHQGGVPPYPAPRESAVAPMGQNQGGQPSRVVFESLHPPGCLQPAHRGGEGGADHPIASGKGPSLTIDWAVFDHRRCPIPAPHDDTKVTRRGAAEQLPDQLAIR